MSFFAGASPSAHAATWLVVAPSPLRLLSRHKDESAAWLAYRAIDGPALLVRWQDRSTFEYTIVQAKGYDVSALEGNRETFVALRKLAINDR